MIASIEEQRGELQGLDVLMLASDPAPDHQAAITTLGIRLQAEHDAEPACDWCGRSAPPAGLEDQSLDGPPSHECIDGEDCQEARKAAEPNWLVNQNGRWWRVDYDKYLRTRQYEAEVAAHSRYGGGIYALSRDVDDPRFVLALAHVRDAVDAKSADYGRLFRRVGERVGELQLAAGIHDPATPHAPPQQVPEPKEGAAAVHRHLGKHLHRQPGETISHLAYRGEVAPPPPPVAKPAPRRRGWAASRRRRLPCYLCTLQPITGDMDLLPVIRTGDLKRRSSWVRDQLLPGIGGRWVNTKSGLHYAFLTVEKPEGFEVERITCAEFQSRVGPVQQRVREWGGAVEVWDSRKGEPAFYVTLTAANEVQLADQRSRYAVSRAGGRTKLYELLGNATLAREVAS